MIGTKEMNLIRDLEDKMLALEEKIKMMTDAMIKIPRIEDYLAKLSLQMKEFSLSEIHELIKDLE